jgi:hypothetical protein
LQQGTQVLIRVVSDLRGIAKAYPAAAPHVAEANDAIRKIMAAIMQHANPGEPAAPPVG